MPEDSIFDDLITNLFSILCILIEIISPADAKGAKALMIANLPFLLVVFRVTAQQAWQ